MLIAITRHTGALEDAALCEKYNHKAKVVSPIKPIKDLEVIERFIKAANEGEFDAIFFPNAYVAEKIGPHIDPRLAKTVRMVANGPQTAKILHNIGIAAEMLPFFYTKDLVLYLDRWIRGKKIGIPRAGNTYPKLAADIKHAGGIPLEYKCYDVEKTGEVMDLTGVGAILFTSPIAFKDTILPKIGNVIQMAIGEVTANEMMYGADAPSVIGDGSIEGTLKALNAYLVTESH